MGQFRLTVIFFPRQGGEPRPLQALVDTGACYSVVPAPILAEFPAQARLALPMRPGNRSLNVSNAVAIVVYEAWRQNGFG